MQAGQEFLLELLGGHNQQFHIPLYQRRYSWTNDQRQQFWMDILAIANKPKANRHFIGSLVYTEPKGGMGTQNLRHSRLIDGQQRVTTTTLLLLVLAEHLEKYPDVAQQIGVTAAEIRQKYLLNEDFNGEAHYKLSLSYADSPTLQALLSGQPLPTKAAQELESGVKFFRKCLSAPGLNLEKVWKGLGKLEVVQITLAEGIDDLGLIFESLNSTGKALAQADLVRNNILMGLDEDDQKKLGEGKWREIEEFFVGTEEGTFDRFMRDFLTMRTRNLPNEDKVYAAFKDYRAGRPDSEKIDVLVQDLHQMAELYLKVIQPKEKETHPEVKQALEDLLALRVRVIQPFVLELLQDRKNNLLDDQTLEKALRAIESFLMRRAIVGERTAPLNRFFATLGRELPKQCDYLLELERALVRFQDRDRDGFPLDKPFEKALQEEPIYTRPVCKPLLVRLERARNTREKVEGVLTIEHVMPQSPGETWQAALGAPDNEKWKEQHAQLVHRLGNLTLTGYNSELGNRPFAEKKIMPPKAGDNELAPRGYKYSRLILTQEIADDTKYPVWNQAVIEQRGAALAQEAVKLFPFPEHLKGELEKLREEGRQRSRTPSVEAQLDTSSQALRALYMEMRSRLMALSPEVIEEPKKQYIAYKAGSNFCDMVPQPALNTVKCWLNIPQDKLDDPNGLTQDVSTRGRASSGNLELVIGLHSDLSVFEHLAKQAMEYQLKLQAEGSSTDVVDFSILSTETAEVMQALEEKCKALGATFKDRKRYRAFMGKQIFIEVYPRKKNIQVALKAKVEDLLDSEKDKWTTYNKVTDWVYQRINTIEALEAAWPTIQRVFDAQQGQP